MKNTYTGIETNEQYVTWDFLMTKCFGCQWRYWAGVAEWERDTTKIFMIEMSSIWKIIRSQMKIKRTTKPLNWGY